MSERQDSTWKKGKVPRGKHHNKTATKTTVSLYLSKKTVEKARKHKLNLSRITEQALTSILDYLEAQNQTESSKFLSAGSFLEESAGAGSSVWYERRLRKAEVAGSNPARSIVREPGPKSLKERIFRTVWELRKRGYADSTIQGYSRKLKTLSKLANLDNPESVRSVVAKKKWSNAFKEAVINAYDHYVKVNGFSWNKPLYRRQRGLPYVATTEQINKIISRASKKYALIFSILRDTGLRPIEIHNLTLENVDLEKGAVTVKSAKFGNPRVLKVQPSTLAMLKEHIQKLNPQLKQKLVPNSSAIRHSFARYRNIVAQKLHEPNLRKIARADPTWTGVFVAIPVGGVWVPINKTTLLAPWIGLASLVTVATASVVYAKRRKKQQN